jgi:hypothetical protein
MYGICSLTKGMPPAPTTLARLVKEDVKIRAEGSMILKGQAASVEVRNAFVIAPQKGSVARAHIPEIQGDAVLTPTH